MSDPGFKPLFALKDNQAEAVVPDRTVWLSASAGTGKTQVLTARVIRLLMQRGVRADNILCLTFTKAGAAEMAERIHQRLSAWVRLPDELLARDLMAIGAGFSPDDLDRARTLFAAVLDTPGGGLRIETIHAFCQSLLASFPAEAGLMPGFRALEDRDAALLAQDTLTRMLVEAEGGPDAVLLDQVAALSLAWGEERTRKWLMLCARAGAIWFGDDAWSGDIRPRLLDALGLSQSLDHSQLAVLCSDAVFPVNAVQACQRAQIAWNTDTGRKLADRMAIWLAADDQQRLVNIIDFANCFYTKNFSKALDVKPGVLKAEPDYVLLADEVRSALDEVIKRQQVLDFVDFAVPALNAGRAFAYAWRDAKAQAGALDFDDMIAMTARLLGEADMGAWVRFKMDRQFDHILVDEAQDTNVDQWTIIEALADDFFSGEGARGDVLRTLFTVGDYKQAIYGFQGTSPVNYEMARKRFRKRVVETQTKFHEPGLTYNFRSSQLVLDAVDAVLAQLGHQALGLDSAPLPHLGDQRPGSVTLWGAVSAPSADDESEEEDAEQSPAEEDNSPEQWLSRPDRIIADRLATQIRQWLDEGLWLHQQNRYAQPGDFMVLVRSRKELAGLIIARLYGQGVPVAGLDRLRLGQPLVVKDLLAAMRFAVQPLDDLNLANLLVSPLIGWSQDELMQRAIRADYQSLWPHLRQSLADAQLAPLYAILERADFEPPYRFLEWLLTGPLQGRRKLLARLGEEARDPMEELVNAAMVFETAHPPVLQDFIRWFDSGDEDIKRDVKEASGQVRVMTVHGAKGLQAPIVVLADAASSPKGGREETLKVALDDGRALPLPLPKKGGRAGHLAQAAEAQQEIDLQEHWRLLYVAMTRAEERLYIAGAVSGKTKKIAEGSWYETLETMLSAEGDAQDLADPLWERALSWGVGAERPARAQEVVPVLQADRAAEPLPDWVQTMAGPEPSPPRPLAPSLLGADDADDPPALALEATDGLDAARRGVLMHRLFERLPELPREARVAAADRWLASQGQIDDASLRQTMIGQAIAVLDDPRWQHVFSADALAEVPVAATIGSSVITGVIDRLVVSDDRVQIIDYKTGRFPPASADAVPVSHLRQMAAYAAAMQQFYPGRQVEAALLYSHGPHLIALPQALLDRYKPA